MPKGRKVPKPRAAYHHGDLRRALVGAALASIAEDGVEGFTLREAARRAGVSPGAPYRHFADKDELISAVAQECGERLGAAMDQALAEAGNDPMMHFRLSGVAYVRFAVEHPAHFRVMSHPAVAARTPLKSGIDEWMSEMATRLLKAQADGQLVDTPIEHIMLFSHAVVHGLASLLVTDARFAGIRNENTEQLALALTELVGTGILPR